MSVDFPRNPDLRIRARFYDKENGGPKTSFGLGFVPLMLNKGDGAYYEVRAYFEKENPILAGSTRELFVIFLAEESALKFQLGDKFYISIPRNIGEGKVLEVCYK